MNVTTRAEMILETIKDVLKNQAVPNGNDTKNLLRYILESEYSSEEKIERSGKLLFERYQNVVAVTHMDTVLFSEDGAEFSGTIIEWNGLAHCVQECLSDGNYMNAAEEKEYQDFAMIEKENAKHEVEKALKSGSREAKIHVSADYGSIAWDALVDDPDEYVRYSVAFYGNEETQLQLVHDPSRAVREVLAEKGTPSVHHSLLAAGDQDADVLQAIMKNGTATVQAAVVERFLDDPEALMKICHDLQPEVKRALLESSDPHIAMLGISEATLKQCQRLSQSPGLNIFEQMSLEDRLEDLNASLPEPAIQ